MRAWQLEQLARMLRACLGVARRVELPGLVQDLERHLEAVAAARAVESVGSPS